jgi:hypothetical protein
VVLLSDYRYFLVWHEKVNVKAGTQSGRESGRTGGHREISAMKRGVKSSESAI